MGRSAAVERRPKASVSLTAQERLPFYGAVPIFEDVVVWGHEGGVAVSAGIKAKDFLNGALFPVSAGAVVAEIATVVSAALKSGATAELGGWAGLAAAAAALMFQIATRKKT